jgi:hypothetical protein
MLCIPKQEIMSQAHTTYRLAALILVLSVCACAAQKTADEGYKVVRQDITYGAGEERARQWDALMAALDICHRSGFTDAQRAQPPQVRCLDSSSGSCRRFAATLSWDCIGMGYQTN